jgi:hypothetical protein
MSALEPMHCQRFHKTTQGYLYSSDGRQKAAAERAAVFERGVLK